MQVEHIRFGLKPRRCGVTLIELLAVVAILGLLMGVVWLAVAGRVKTSAKQARIKSDMRQVVVAMNLYRNDNDGGLPSDWQYIGYYTLVKKGSHGDGYPLRDIYNPRPPIYDVSYHTPECAQPPRAQMGLMMLRQSVARFEARPRINTLDIDLDQAVRFAPACLVSSFAEHSIKILRDGNVGAVTGKGYKSLGANLSGTLFYDFDPAWLHETIIGNQ